MKKVFLLALLAICVNAASHAQGFQRQTPEEQVAALKTSLKLSDAQVAKLTPVFAAQSKSMDSLFQSANGDFGSLREKMTPLRTKYTAQINAVLTPEQATTYKKQQDELRARFQQGQN